MNPFGSLSRLRGRTEPRCLEFSIWSWFCSIKAASGSTEFSQQSPKSFRSRRLGVQAKRAHVRPDPCRHQAAVGEQVDVQNGWLTSPRSPCLLREQGRSGSRHHHPRRIPAICFLGQEDSRPPGSLRGGLQHNAEVRSWRCR